MTGKSNVPTASMLKSMIIVTAPTGSTVTCTNGSVTKTAIERNGTWTFRGILTGTWTVKGTKSGQSTSKTVTITRLEVEYVTLTYRVTPEFTYTGSYKILTDSDGTISDFASYKGNWKIKFLTSGTFKITNMYGFDGNIDVFLVGGGAAGLSASTGKGQGGSGGYTKTVRAKHIAAGTSYSIVIGGSGGNTSGFGESASRGESWKGGSGSGSYNDTGNGGNGGSDGSNGGGPHPGSGQGKTTREFGESGKTLYSGGGGGGCYNYNNNSWKGGTGGAGGGGNGGTSESPNAATAGAANTGGGGGGGVNGRSGGSGVVIIRNKR